VSLRLLSSSTTQITDIRACTRTRTYSVLSVVSLSRSRSHLFSILFHASIDPYCIDCNVPWEQFAKKDSERESKRLSFAGCFEKKCKFLYSFFFSLLLSTPLPPFFHLCPPTFPSSPLLSPKSINYFPKSKEIFKKISLLFSSIPPLNRFVIPQQNRYTLNRDQTSFCDYHRDILGSRNVV